MTELIATANSADDAVLDDCWNRIGIRGDRSCSRLEQFVHCHNCDIYADAAKHILDRYQLHRQDDGDTQVNTPAAPEPVVTESFLVFRLGEEWLGLPVRALVEVAPLQLIHSLPRRRSASVLGVSNVRGALVAVLALGSLLGLDEAAASSGRSTARMLIIGSASEGNVVCPVDEVSGVHAVPSALLSPRGSGKYSRGIFQWQSRSVRLLDDTLLLQAITRNLA